MGCLECERRDRLIAKLIAQVEIVTGEFRQLKESAADVASWSQELHKDYKAMQVDRDYWKARALGRAKSEAN